MNQATKQLVDLLRISDLKTIYGGVSADRVEVDDMVSRLSSIYEKIRNAIDYKEDHLLRQNAIKRILLRRLSIRVNAQGTIGNALVKEIISAGYVENKLIPVSRAEGVDGILEKYLAVFNLSGYQRTTSEGNKIFSWLISLAAVEIEEMLFPPLDRKALVDFMYQTVRSEVNIVDKGIDPRLHNIQIYVAVYRALIKVDEAFIHYILLRHYYPDWQHPDKLEVQAVAKRLRNLKLEIERQAEHPIGEKLLRVFKKYSFAFLILRDIIINNKAKADSIISDPEQLEYFIRQQCALLYQQRRSKLRRSIVRVTIYIFITKMMMALLLEFPYDYYIAKSVTWLPLVINALYPPFAIFLVGVFISLPSKSNTDKIVAIIKDLVGNGKLADVSKIASRVRQAPIKTGVFYGLYVLLFMVSFGAIMWFLNQLHFNAVSQLIFLLFLSVISFFIVRVRQGIREMKVSEQRESGIFFLINLFTFPYLKVGHWISTKIAKINFFAFFLDFIIEAPLKIFLEVIEDWLSFLREKKEEIYNQSGR